MFLVILGCGETQIGESQIDDTVAGASPDLSQDMNEASGDTRDCSTLSESELVKLKQLQSKISYDVLVPTCVPTGYYLETESILKRDPVAGSNSGGDHPEYDTKPFYSFSLTNGNETIDFAGNMVGDAPISDMAIKKIRGRDALVFYSRGENLAWTAEHAPFEESPFYYILWDEEKDLTGGSDRYGVYFTHAELDWETLSSIVNSMVSANEIEIQN